MTLSIGEKVSLPSHGPCVIGAVVNKLVGGTSTSFYRLAPLEDNGGELFIPVDKITGLGIRQLLKQSEIPKLLGRLSQPGKLTPPPSTARNWKQRALDNGKLLASGAAADLVQIVESLTDLNETKTLAPHERQTLERAKKLLVCEISEVLGETRSAVEEQIERALQGRKAGGKDSMEKAQDRGVISSATNNCLDNRSGSGARSKVVKFGSAEDLARGSNRLPALSSQIRLTLWTANKVTA